MDTYVDFEMWQWAVDNGLSVDMGMAPGGPFVNDNRVRIYDSDTNGILAEGDDIRDAIENYCLTLED